MKRFTETTKWGDPWFRKLPMESKLFWQWMLDHCDHAGVIDPDVELAAFQIGYRKGKANLLESLGDRITKLPNGKIWIVKFMDFQFSKLSDKCPAHRPVYQSIEKNGLDTLPKGYPKGIPTLKDKDKDKGKDKGKDKESILNGKEWNPDPTQSRLNALYRRRPSNPWDAKMLKVYRAISFDDEEIALVEKFHADPEAYKRKSLSTLLNTWDEEVDRARMHRPAKNQPVARTASRNQPVSMFPNPHK